MCHNAVFRCRRVVLLVLYRVVEIWTAVKICGGFMWLDGFGSFLRGCVYVLICVFDLAIAFTLWLKCVHRSFNSAVKQQGHAQKSLKNCSNRFKVF